MRRKKSKYKPTVYRLYPRPVKPEDVMDVWSWQAQAGQMRHHESELTDIADTIESQLKRKDLSESDRASYNALQEQIAEALVDVREEIQDSAAISNQRMDFDIALDLLCKAWDNDVLYPHAENTYAVFSEGRLHQMQLEIAIRSVGGYVHFADWDTEAFYMYCPETLDAIQHYIEDRED